jgi:hypothetical protein
MDLSKYRDSIARSLPSNSMFFENTNGYDKSKYIDFSRTVHVCVADMDFSKHCDLIARSLPSNSMLFETANRYDNSEYDGISITTMDASKRCDLLAKGVAETDNDVAVGIGVSERDGERVGQGIIDTVGRIVEPEPVTDHGTPGEISP